jgi:hypothetical protein
VHGVPPRAERTHIPREQRAKRKQDEEATSAQCRMRGQHARRGLARECCAASTLRPVNLPYAGCRGGCRVGGASAHGRNGQRLGQIEDEGAGVVVDRERRVE